MVVTMVLLAALVVAPAAARVDINTLEPGDTVYVGEENLVFGPAFGTEPVTKLVHFTDQTADKTILVSDPANFELKKSEVGTTIGGYYLFGDTASEKGKEVGTIEVLIPSVALDVVLNASRMDSVDGKSITRDNVLDFKVQNNLVGFAGVAGAPTMNIMVTLPGGGATNQFGGLDLRGIPADGTTAYLGGISLADAAAGTYTAVAKWPAASDFYGKGFDSNVVTFEVVVRDLSISANKDAVIRGKSFTVSITGEAKKDYRLLVRDVEGLTQGEYPVVAPGQVGIRDYSPTDVTVTTNAAGTRTVQFNTNQSTGDWGFTIRVEDPADPTRCDEVRVRVERGDVTITAAGTGVYAIGEEITLSGTCTDSDTVYLFLTGPNLPTNGVRLSDTAVPVEDGNPATFTRVDVEADDTWSYKWNTGDVTRSLDAGGYTIYAVSEPRWKDNLIDARFATTSIQLRPPSLTVRTSGTTLTRGDDYQIAGTATGDPDSVRIWIFGPNCQKLGVLVLVENNGSFEYTLTGAETSDLAKGQYYVIVQHPVTNGFDVIADGTRISGPGIVSVDLSRLQAFDAATALINALDSPNVDDIYIKVTFTVADSWIRIDGVGDQIYGETFTVTGTTDYPAGTALTCRITAKEDGVTVLSGEAVVAENGDWSFEVDTVVIGPGVFTIRVMSPDGQVSTTALFDVYDDMLHPVTPPGATYQIESIRVNPPLNELSPGESLTLTGTMGAPWFGYQGCLEFSTDLEDLVWSYSLERDGAVICSGSRNSRSFTLSAFELDYGQDIRILLSFNGTVPQRAEDQVLLRILERDAGGRVVPESEYRLSFTPSGGGTTVPADLTLHSGWNFISVPRPLVAGNDTALIFAPVETGGRSIFRYDTAAGEWVPLAETDQIAPLEGFWIYSTGPATVSLNFSTDPLLPPAKRSLSTGWNAIGVTGAAPATARDTLLSVNREWTTLIGFDAGKQAFETGIVNGGSGDYTDSRLVYQGKGYWLYMTEPGTLCAIGA
ncbi:MEMAR_RS02690 family S-layer glycoprotein [Methanoculleus bourgensis]|uniref:MEMAR_RS02690 family S-layer glycoprotein n=1 Tax=Methanoculleus bourgensis TaxID=83986 RepID=UPI003B945996